MKDRKDKRDRRNERGVTLVEVITVMTILAVLAAVITPSLLGFIEKTRIRQYVAEAYSVRGAAQMLVTEEYAAGTLNNMDMMLKLLDGDLHSEEGALYPYLRMTCSPGARLTGVTVDTGTGQVLEIVYEAAGYKITLDESGSQVEETSGRDSPGH